MKQVEKPLKSIFAFPQKLFLLTYTCNYQMLNIQGPVCVVPLLGSFHSHISRIAWKQGNSLANCFLCTQKHCIYSHGIIKTSISTLERQWEEGAVFNSRMKGKKLGTLVFIFPELIQQGVWAHPGSWNCARLLTRFKSIPAQRAGVIEERFKRKRSRSFKIQMKEENEQNGKILGEKKRHPTHCTKEIASKNEGLERAKTD